MSPDQQIAQLLKAHDEHEAKIAELEAKLAEAGKDSERLDKLEAGIASFGPVATKDDPHPVAQFCFEAPFYEPEDGGLRAAIDLIE